MRDSIESILTRVISIGSKFLLLGYLAKIMSLQDYGSFQLISYFVLISTSILGLEYYNISNRQIAENPNKTEIYDTHFNFIVRLSPLLLLTQILLYLTIFPKELITVKNIVLVLLIGCCDYISQEVYRYLMIAKAFRKGNIQLIFKSTVFLILVAAYVFIYKTITLNQLLWIMLGSYVILLLVAYLGFTKNLYVFQFRYFKVLRWDEIKSHFVILWPFILLVFCLKGIEFSDKFIIGKQLGLKDAGIYSFMFAIASAINVFIVSGFYIIYLPQLINNFKNDIPKFKLGMLKFAGLTIVFSIVLAIAILFFSTYIFQLIGKPEFLGHLNLLYILLLGFVLNNISLIPHLFLYVCHDEKMITVIVGIAFFINIALNLILVPMIGIEGAAYSFLITYLCILLLKLIRALAKWRKIAV